MLFDYLTPDLYRDEIITITPTELKAMGIKGIICDLDNTIIPWDEEELSEEIIQWFQQIETSGLKICLLSNSLHTRVSRIANHLGIEGVPAAVKPRKKAFLTALKRLDLSAEEVIVIGDQIFTDILGSKRVGIKAILVKPLASKEFFWTRFMRRLEHRVMRHRKKSGHC